MNGHSHIDVGAQLIAPTDLPNVGEQLIAPSHATDTAPHTTNVGAQLIASSATPPIHHTSGEVQAIRPRHRTINLNAYLEIQGLKKSFGLKPILRGVNLSLGQGERMALLGANGAGKTTLLRILAGLTKPSLGTATIAELDIVRSTQQIRHLVGFLSHQPYLYDELTALENLLFFAKMYTVKHAHCSSSTNPIRGSIRQGIPLSKHSWQNTPPTEVPCCLPPIILSVPCNSVIPLLYYTKAGSPFKKKPSDWS